MHRPASAALLAAALSCAGGGGAPAIGEVQRGEGTFYDFANGDGACMFGPSPGDLDVAALNDPQWDGSSACGACARVTGPKGTVRLRIVDRCPECKAGDLDLSPQSFARIAELSQGRVAISWQLEACDVAGNIRYHVKDGSSQWWTAIQVRNHRLPVRSLAFRRGASWVEVPRADYNYFVAEQGTGPGPIRVRITAWDGQALEDDLPGPNAEATYDGTGQFR